MRIQFARFLLIGLIGLTSLLANAQSADPNIQKTVYLDDRTLYTLIYQQSGVWKLQVIESRPGRLQQSIYSHTYKTEKAAEAAQDSYLKKHGYTADDEQADLGVVADAPGTPASGPEASDDGTSIWPITQSWDITWEHKYQQWIASSVDRNFFVKYSLATDCADVIISTRWIFARMNGLPVANTLTGTGQMVGSMTMAPEWKNLPTAGNWYEDQRFLNALNYVLENTYTRSLSVDSYPIAINRQTLVTGTFHLEFHQEGGHAMLVKNVVISGQNARIQTLNSTEPRAVRQLITLDYVFGDQAIPGTGFRRVMWPIKVAGRWKFDQPKNYPDYSEEQYAPNFMQGQGTFSAAVYAHLTGNNSFNLRDWNTTLLLLENAIKTRANSVYDGYNACLTIDCAPNTDGWAAWSTPGRDQTLSSTIRGAVKSAQINANNRQAMDLWKQFLAKSFPYDEGPGKTLTYGYVVDLFTSQGFDSDPRDPIAKRWGLKN